MISLIALLVTIIFVKKDKETKYKAVAIISIVLNVIICLTMLPLATILGLLIDINGGGPEFYRQTTYFMPALFVLCITASVALRRKGYSVISLITGLIGPAIFAIDLIVNILI